MDLEKDIIIDGVEFNPYIRRVKLEKDIKTLRKKESEVLFLLCSTYPDAVTYTDLSAKIWPHSYVSRPCITQIIHALREILGDSGRNKIQTIPKLGYRLISKPLTKDGKDFTFVYKNHSEISGIKTKDYICQKIASVITARQTLQRQQAFANYIP
ncbi:winged helix-turn-helix domain-containing protein [Erwinia amylovora]|uniref:Protein rcaC n=4 Tax=Erwinia amylovora TaxID=552 RepID=A0A831A3J6_ERWAM|nr:winged helix-turn-helix domain-containing protein [Erwinia amylovora]CBX79651.1 Protein rcaC [Erwinia amylovora ATCC BAA-2158]CDK14378.1 Protein rcaC [Erwinia amylovora LA635]CDK17745.1 Protein rcaC [Erwinia amylovora LA636]CDK21114.1 Protein rcaC [Erwinia amylovora LA637]ATZ12411.1 transcriptional regulator [Erwinia amylovora]